MTPRQPATLPRPKGDDGELTASLQRHGMLQPIVVRKADGRIILGARRQRVASAHGIKSDVVAIDVDEIEAATMRLSEECSKSDIPATERAEALVALRKLLTHRGVVPTQKALAKRVGLTEHQVEWLFRIATVPEPIKKILRGTTENPNVQAAVTIGHAKLTESQRERLAEKVAIGALVDGKDGNIAKAIEFVQTAEPEARDSFLASPKRSLEAAKDYNDKKHVEKENTRRRESREKHYGFDWRGYFDSMDAQVQRWTLGLQRVMALASYVPPGPHRRRLPQHLTKLADACQEFIERMESDERDPTRPVTERVARIAAEQADLWE
jgi:ParB/RepB/Spo0J family partition protein